MTRNAYDIIVVGAAATNEPGYRQGRSQLRRDLRPPTGPLAWGLRPHSAPGPRQVPPGTHKWASYRSDPDVCCLHQGISSPEPPVTLRTPACPARSGEDTQA